MIVRELLELIEEKRKLYPGIDDYRVATLIQSELYHCDISSDSRVVINHQIGLVVISASE